ncbi:hypothetical protein SASPL_132931 [Salvia splendens]|uniref:Terpene synthase N-terminal domain-containing protein n=1 Tax=Salvia splendens TaxID=180675 RepID=A0A8X8ZHL5_SALSN|nr:hypothetical protein SASPL_132931 [Salvia splendens]
MTIMSTLNLSTTTVTSRRLHQPAEVHLPEFYAVCAWLNSSIKHARLSCRIGRKQLSKLTECRGTYPSKKSSLTRALVTAVASLDASQVSEENPPLQVNNQIEDCIEHVKSLLTTSGDGRISVSPYDTSIVALIKDLEGRDAPQIPSCLEWIARHQKADGSWGDDFFCIYDRILNTLACVVALKSWNLRDDMMEKGVTYINENVHKLKDGNIEHMTSGFEIVFPALVQRAKNVGVQGLPYDHPLIKEIASIKEERLKKIPKDMIYQTPTSLLYSLEGIGDLEWENMLKLQSADGSFLTSPSSTAYVFMHTKDQKCFDFIQNAVKNCNGGDVLEHFKQQDGKFSCYSGQMIESASPIYNLYRAAQLRFPGEEILEEASQFAYNFLQQKISNHQLQEKWVIYHHFIDEVKLGLKMPWYATLPRVEAAYYLQHYAGSGDVWIGKVFYRMPEISNDRYKELAILDFNRCQAQHQLEWTYMLEWYHKNSVCEFGISKRDLLRAYFLAAATIFEPERTQERLVWTKTQIVSRMITSFLNHGTALSLDQITLVTQIDGLDQAIGAMKDHGLAGTLLTTFQQLLDGFDRYTRLGLKNAWSQWILKLQQGEANSGDEAELLANTVNICTGLTAINGDVLSHLEYTTLSTLTNKICKRLSLIKDKKTLEVVDGGITDKELEQDTQALVKLALEENGGCIDRNIKQTFLSVFKTCYYSAYHDDETIDVHIFKVLFEPAV